MSKEVLEEKFRNLSLYRSSDVVNDGEEDRKRRPYIRRRTKETDLNEILKDIEISSDVSTEKILILSREDVIDIFCDQFGNLVVSRKDVEMVVSFDVEQLETIFGNDDIVHSLKDRVDFQTFLEIIKKYSVETVISILRNENPENCEEYSMSDILQRYDDDYRHLTYMADDPNLVVLLNFNNPDLVEFGLSNYNINIPWVRRCIVADDRHALPEFDRLLTMVHYYASDDSQDEYENDSEFDSDENISRGSGE